MNYVIELNGVSKSYGSSRGVLDLHVRIAEGQITGLLGPNGCGKTTLIKLIMGLLQPDTGEVLLAGKAPRESLHLVSYLPEKTYLRDSITMKEAFDIFTAFYADFSVERARHILSEFRIEERIPLRNMSKGMQEKAQLSLVMGRECSLYILDEPMGGVDPLSRETILREILQNYHPGSAMLLSTHLVSEVESIFERVLFMDEGRIIEDVEVEKIRMEENMSIDAYFRKIYRNKEDRHVG